MKLKRKSYLHFDNYMNKNNAKKYLKDISSHQYLPFINYDKIKKIWQKNHIKEIEYRTIYICSHKDNYVYQYFNNKLNPIYEKYIENNNLSNNVCAFRKNTKKSNVHYANEILKYIKSQHSAHILILDISKFFDNLDHSILKTNLKKILNTESLSKELYSMLKNLEKSSYINIEDIYKILIKEGIYIEIDNKKLNKEGNYYLWDLIQKFGHYYNWNNIISKDSFKKYKKEYLRPTKKEQKEKNKGIPQGTPISGTLSNIYMIDFDLFVSNIVKEINGKYLRYCDDIIIVIPNYNDDNFQTLINEIKKYLSNIKLEIKEEKLQILKYENQKIINLKEPNNNIIQFLGFVLKNNAIIDMRESTKQKHQRKTINIANDYQNIKTDKNIDAIKKEIYSKTIIDGEKGNYKKYTFGNYQTKAANIIGGNILKQSKKKTIELINKHL